MHTEYLPLLLFAGVFLTLLTGYPVAFTLGGLSILTGLATVGLDFFYLLPLRVYGTMSNYILIAVPLFIFMGIMLEKSGLAENLLHTMSMVFGRYRGGLAISVIIVGGLLAASTGIVGATVITMGLISLPIMLKRGYPPTLATGTIAASGTLGQIIPPSVVLVLLGSVLNVSVGKLFKSALIPGLVLVLMYILYVSLYALFNPSKVPAIDPAEIRDFRKNTSLGELVRILFLPLLLILTVLGSIFLGIASPTEAAALGALGATLLTILQKKFSMKVLRAVMRETTRLTSMVFMILVGATAFSLVFRGLGGDRFLTSWIETANLSPEMFLLMVMVMVFVAGFFIDFIEIIFIFVPVITPILSSMGIDFIWVGILLALNLQTSFLSPPFGFALFYLKGVSPPEIQTSHLYRGIIPFVGIQLVLLTIIILFPEVIYLLK
ncbi:MAG: TRAP transporter large permease subunit [Bacteroidota bacterium]